MIDRCARRASERVRVGACAGAATACAFDSESAAVWMLASVLQDASCGWRARRTDTYRSDRAIRVYCRGLGREQLV